MQHSSPGFGKRVEPSLPAGNGGTTPQESQTEKPAVKKAQKKQSTRRKKVKMVTKATQTEAELPKPPAPHNNQPRRKPYQRKAYEHTTPRGNSYPPHWTQQSRGQYQHQHSYGHQVYEHNLPSWNKAHGHKAYEQSFPTWNEPYGYQAYEPSYPPWTTPDLAPKPPPTAAPNSSRPRPANHPNQPQTTPAQQPAENREKAGPSQRTNKQGSRGKKPAKARSQPAAPNPAWSNKYAPLGNYQPEELETNTYTPAPPAPRQPTNSAPRPGKAPLLPVSSPQINAISRGYYLPGKLTSKTLKYLVDTGCTNTVLSTSMFNELPEHVRAGLRAVSGSATAANGNSIPTHGWIKLKGRIRNQPIETDFMVADILEDAILGLDFLEKEEATISFKTAELTYRGKKLVCVDHQGKPLMARVYLPHAVQVPAHSEYILSGKIQQEVASDTVMITDLASQHNYLIGSSVNSLDRPAVYVRLLNPTGDTLQLPAGKLIAQATALEHTEVLPTCKDGPGIRNMTPQDLPPIPTHLQEIWQGALKTCTTKLQRNRLHHLLTNYSDVFSANDHDVGCTPEMVHSIPTHPGAQPIKQRARRLGPEKEKEVDKQVQELHKHGFIEPGSGAWSSPVVLVRKKDSSWRFCIDYRLLNQATVKDAYPLPRIDESLDALAGSQFFSTLDLTSGYWQVPLDEEARDKSAFVTRNELWRWKVLPFGLTSAPSTFERLMEKVLRGLHWQTVLIYLDDVVVFSQSVEQHLERLEEVLARLRSAKLKLKPKKCELFKLEVKYLGHVVSKDGISTDPDKIKAMATWPQPGNLTDVRSFLGATGYYRRFIKDYAKIAKPLTRLTLKNTPFEWTTEAHDAFLRLRRELTQAPILGYPDPKLPYLLDTDASDTAAGAVLSQLQHSVERPVAYYSKTFSAEEKNYCVTQKELLAVLRACQNFRPYLYGRPFLLRTDHESLRWMTRLKEPRGQLARWLEELQEFQMDIQHRKGVSHGNADALSRRPCPSECKPCSRQEETSTEATPGVTMVQHANPVTLAQRQQTEAPLRILYHVVQQSQAITDEQLQEADSELKRWAKLQDHARLREDGVLQVQINQSYRTLLVTAAPPSIRKALITEVHHANHMGEYRTYRKLQLNWYWPGMQGDVRRQVRNCAICQQQKNSHQPDSTTKRHLYTGRPWQRVAIDFTGPLDETPRGNKWILVVTDHFSRWCDAYPLPDSTAESAARVLEERVFSQFGIPETIHSDQGRQFTSRLFEQLCTLWGCDKTQTSPYRPQANGLCERLNRTLGDALRTMLADRELPVNDWDLLLPTIMRNIRSVPHTATGETANYLMLGRELRLPNALLHEVRIAESQSPEAYAAALQERLHTAHQLLRERQLRVRTTDTEEPPLFKAGDLVWLKSYQHKKGMAKARKLQPKFIGPYKIIEVLPYHTYRLSKNGKESVEYEGRIKLHVAHQAEPATLPLPPQPTKTTARKNPALPTTAGRQPITYGRGEPYQPLMDHTLEIESLPNFTPRHEPNWPAIEGYELYPPEPIIEEPRSPSRRAISSSCESSHQLSGPAPPQRRRNNSPEISPDHSAVPASQQPACDPAEFPTLTASTQHSGRYPSRTRKPPERLSCYDLLQVTTEQKNPLSYWENNPMSIERRAQKNKSAPRVADDSVQSCQTQLTSHKPPASVTTTRETREIGKQTAESQSATSDSPEAIQLRPAPPSFAESAHHQPADPDSKVAPQGFYQALKPYYNVTGSLFKNLKNTPKTDERYLQRYADCREAMELLEKMTGDQVTHLLRGYEPAEPTGYVCAH